MAPTSPVKRVTRARAAAKKTTDSIDAPLRKTTASKITKNTSSRKPTTTNEEVNDEQAQPKRVTSRTTAKTAPLAAVPRRRIKVTPLDAPPAQEEPAPQPAAALTKQKKGSARTQKAAAATQQTRQDSAPIEDQVSVPKTRTRAAKSATPKTTGQELEAPKARGRPKKGAPEPQQVEGDQAKPTRQTRARSGSNVETSLPKTTAPTKIASRKKVTFQDLLDDDKENQTVPSKKATTKKEVAPATGMRAKPVRKPAATTVKKNTVSSKAEDEKPVPRALTPKKITQVSRSAVAEESDEEDVLSGEKTPMRDLSQSPKRNATLAAQLSPVKKLDFSQSLGSTLPEKAAESMLCSPARRPPPSPFKETLRQSPKRSELANIFPETSKSTTAAVALMPSSHSQSMLLQSPKRAPIDSAMFSQSAIKPQNSPLKTSLLFSPAKRLFSPAKQRTPAAMSKPVESTTPMDVPEIRSMGTPEDIAISSHFRASVSPQRSARVHRMSDEELADELRNEVDFDASVLNIRSPLKVSKPKPAALSVRIEEDFEMAKEIGHDDEEVGELHSADAEIDQAGIENVDQDEQDSEILQDFQQVKEAEPVTVESMADIEKSHEMPGLRISRISSGPRLSEVLFRSTRLRDEDESSEDELTADQTPDRAINPFRSSLTGANIRSRLSGGLSSRSIGFTPLAAQMSGWLAASPEKKIEKVSNKSHGTFSPVAAQHVDGEVQVSRQTTPQQRKSPGTRQSLGLKKSLTGRTSLAPSTMDSPEKTSYFADQMSAQDIEDQVNRDDGNDGNDNLHALVEASEAGFCGAHEQAAIIEPEQGEEMLADEEDDTIIVGEANGELTTDLINFTNASDTALVDFAHLAQEAERLAPQDDEAQICSSESVYGDENTAPVEVNASPETHEAVEEVPAIQSTHETFDIAGEAEQVEVAIDTNEAPDVSTGIPISPPGLTRASIEIVTPARPDYSQPRFLNTIVSKVPLRPEGEVSPIKMPKKRSRSFSTDAPGSTKRHHLAPSTAFGVRSASENTLSPERRIRSAAPSPAHTTPGQMSFVIDDFGDSTLDGIELPDNEMDFDVTETPATIKSTKNVVTPSRTPLKAVGGGVLHGAVVYVDVHTTEGADASSIFVDLLTQMGAKCVKEWRWNPRASVAGEETPGKVGITHVVFKDGGKRTLEKVRDAKGDVWCVGVGWVLDCERESKWLDEATYTVDHSILPRGGSRRRKSMEPRALINANGSLSTARRSVSAEMTEKMKEELINTPVRGYAPRDLLDEDTEISSTYNSPTTTMNVGITTPTALVNWDPATAMTPAPVDTPYLMSQGSKLVQMSCPPKQTNKGIFDNGEGEASRVGIPREEKLKLKLAEARRRTMGWKPRVGSPLGKT